ncbi:PTS sugar transporter subunit IIB [Clostridium sp. YIM B02551]|uniref:PTS sugar transporter subunit IIB n=1 Tax=Clostridium sp. YIM B02551 TaxID=2910679 RepID=UPI001EE9D768|nr:PTS sugar transporter subunit IIB [Clostridium sp. YIM B02551]
MTKILLCCAAGMSTSLLVESMEDAAKEQGIEAKIWAISVSLLESNIGEADVVLVGPQIKFKLKHIKSVADEKSIPVELISTVDYGRVDGKNVLKQALRLINRG